MNVYNLRLLAQELQYLRGLYESAQQQGRDGKCAAYSELIHIYEDILNEAGYKFVSESEQLGMNN